MGRGEIKPFGEKPPPPERTVSVTPIPLKFENNVAGEEKPFIKVENVGEEEPKLENLALAGEGAAEYEITDKNKCAGKMLIRVAPTNKCEVTIKMKNANAKNARWQANAVYPCGVKIKIEDLLES